MSESAIADFVAKFNATSLVSTDPITGRILLSPKRLVLAADSENKLTIPLSAVYDVAVGQIPEDLDGFFDATVAVRFERGDRRHAAVVEADDGTIGKFSTLLFKALLNGTDATLKHPARVGGRVTDREFLPAKLAVETGLLRVRHADGTVEIDLDSVIGFGQSTREIAGSGRSVLQVRHVQAGRPVLTMVAAGSNRTLSVLARYLRLEYTDLLADVQKIELSAVEKRLLVALYAGAGGERMALPELLDADEREIAGLIERFADEGLVVETDDETRLTRKGQVLADIHLENVDG